MPYYNYTYQQINDLIEQHYGSKIPGTFDCRTWVGLTNHTVWSMRIEKGNNTSTQRNALKNASYNSVTHTMAIMLNGLADSNTIPEGDYSVILEW